ncbi:hypothetical protein BC835DRAFT_1421093 [Cytidiella melzeri]|nr:hypothetical protein BC835DRAFT_1421093 [Cytidiella melzeri]
MTGIQSDSEPVAAALFGYSSSTALTSSDIYQRLTGRTPPGYAAEYLPNHVESLLQRGEDATVGCPLTMAANWGSISIIKPLVEAGARVNAYHTRKISSLEPLIQHPDGVFAHKVKTSPLAIEICQSIFHADRIVVVEDLLEERKGLQLDPD